MSNVAVLDANAGHEASIARRANDLFGERRQEVLARVDRMFLSLMLGQWVFGILVAVFFSPYGWEGKVKAVHFHVWAAVLVGGALTLFPVILAALRPGATLTRHVMAASQMLWSALLIHLSGGRIETHFHVFGSLAFLAFYYDWKVLNTATVIVAGEHFLRGVLWPESIYGITNPEWWRFLEHAFWVLFTDAFLLISCQNGLQDMKSAARRQAELENLAESEEAKSLALQMVLAEAGAR